MVSTSSKSAAPIVEAVALTKVFRDFWMRTKARAVDNVDLEIRPREIFGLLGPNGSGKSTIIKMILGLLHKTSGRLSVFGRLPSDVAVKRHIGFLPEESYLYRFLNPRETLDYYGRLFSLDHRTRRRRTDELLDMVGLAQVAHRPIGEFSKGMTRRIGLAQALINDPEFLILDEPTSGLDPIGTRQVKDLLLDLGRRGKTILLSSHLLGDVEDVCDRMVVLYGGKIRAEGTPEELLSVEQSTVIQTPRLKPETIARIEQVLRESEQVAIEKVTVPRQKLEQLFMEIVLKAQQEQVATSGAMQGSTTAAFLRGEGAEGDSLIDRLVTAQDAPAARAKPVAPRDTAASTPQAAVPTDEREQVLRDLMQKEQAERRGAEERAARKASQVDSSLIDSLIDGPKREDGEANRPARDTDA